MHPNPGRGISRLLFLVALATLPFIFVFGGPADRIVGWTCVGLAALVIGIYALLRIAGSDKDREEFPAPRQLGRQLATDLRPIGRYITTTWRNIGGW